MSSTISSFTACGRALPRLPFSLLALAILLSACGGGGGGGGGGGTQGETINGIAVPPVPDSQANQATLAGVDANANGIRDDIERSLATNFGTDAQLLPIATEHARAVQAVVVTGSEFARDAYVNRVRCISDSTLLARLSGQTKATLDNDSRRRAYAKTMAGAALTSEGC